MVKVTLEAVNEYQTKLVADGKEVILTNLEAKAEYDKKQKIKEFIFIMFLCLLLLLSLGAIMLSPKEEKYKPEYKTQNGSLIDLDDDGLFYIEE